MQTLYENWTEAGENWSKAKIFLQVSSANRNVKLGEREWMTKLDLERKFGEDGASSIICRKLEDKELRKTEVRFHPDAPEDENLMQFRVLNLDKESDSNETTINRLFKAVDDACSSSDSESSVSSSSSSSESSAPKKKGKKTKKDKKPKETKKAKAKVQSYALD